MMRKLMLEERFHKPSNALTACCINKERCRCIRWINFLSDLIEKHHRSILRNSRLTVEYFCFSVLPSFPPAWAFPPSLALLLNVVKIQLGGHVLQEPCSMIAIVWILHMGFPMLPFCCSHRVYTKDRVIGKQISMQNVSPLSFMATQHNNGYFCNLCCVIQKWKSNEMCLLACGENDCYCGYRACYRHFDAPPLTHEQNAHNCLMHGSVWLLSQSLFWQVTALSSNEAKTVPVYIL